MSDEYCNGVYLKMVVELSFYLDEDVGMEGAGRAKGTIQVRRAFSSLSIRFMSNVVRRLRSCLLHSVKYMEDRA